MMYSHSIDAIQEVANWQSEAKDEDSRRYFYHYAAVGSLENGSKNYVIGRKGTGKTAIAEYIRNSTASNQFSRILSFKNFPFNLLYEHTDGSYTSPNQFITLWEYVIYTSICHMMAENKAVNYDSRTALAKIFNYDLEGALQQSVRLVTDREFGLNILGVGGNISSKKTAAPAADIPIAVRNQFLAKYISTNASNANYYVMFDALDEDYKDILRPDRKSPYFDLLIGLFKAAQNVRHAFSKNTDAKIIPIIFLRDDIFDLCRDPDKNKWLDRSVSLRWDTSQLKNLIAFRLSRALDPHAQPLPFNDAWRCFFTSLQYRGHRRHSDELFKILLHSTFNRPRDIINYIKECASIALNEQSPRISNEMLSEADHRQSEYMRREVIDETYSIIEDISEVFDLLSELRKPIFTVLEFTRRYENYLKTSRSTSAIDADTLMKTLYHFNVFGNITTGNHQVFAYNTLSKKFNTAENICIHRGLLKVLEIN